MLLRIDTLRVVAYLHLEVSLENKVHLHLLVLVLVRVLYASVDELG